MLKLWYRKISHGFLFLFAANLIDQHESSCIKLLSAEPTALQSEHPAQKDVWRLVQQYAFAQGLADEPAARQLMQKARFNQDNIEKSIQSLRAASLLDVKSFRKGLFSRGH